MWFLNFRCFITQVFHMTFAWFFFSFHSYEIRFSLILGEQIHSFSTFLGKFAPHTKTLSRYTLSSNGTNSKDDDETLHKGSDEDNQRHDVHEVHTFWVNSHRPGDQKKNLNKFCNENKKHKDFLRPVELLLFFHWLNPYFLFL